MKKIGLLHKTGFVVFVLMFGLFRVGCAKEPLIEYQMKNSEPDTVLHNGSNYIAVIGDIQYYTSSGYLQYYDCSLQWIASHANQISFIMHTGDVTNNNFISQWENFRTVTAPYTNVVPFYTCIGNHDYLCNAPNMWNYRDSTRFSQYVGFPSSIEHIVASFEDGHYENILVRESLFDGDSIYLLVLELNPRLQVVNWADSLVKSIPNTDIILITHRYINADAERVDYLYYIIDPPSTTPQYVWENLVYNNDNIRCVLCGHIRPRSRILYSTNAAGRIVPQIEFNIQYEPNGGNGIIELWEFNGDDNVYVRTFNTNTETFVNGSLSNFQFRFR